MLSDRSRQVLADIAENVRLAWQFTEGVAFEADRRTVYAITRCLEIISEASRRLDDEVRQRHADLPWRAIMGSGNVYRHGYDNIAEQLVGQTVTEGLGAFLAMADAQLA